MSESTVGFVATKPLQIMTALTIARQLAGSPAILCVVPAFADAERITMRLRSESSAFADVLPIANRTIGIATLARRGADRIFLHSDIGVTISFAMNVLRTLRPGLRFAVYEEGLSLFEPRVDERPRKIFSALGASAALAEAPLTQEVWTYDPASLRERLPSKVLKPIEPRLGTFVQDEWALLRRVFWPRFDADVRVWKGTRCCLYLSSWDVDPRMLRYLAASEAFTICKLHPHIRHDVGVPAGVDQILHASTPAELLITALADRFDRIEVVHHGTSATRYVDLPNVRFVQAEDVQTNMRGQMRAEGDTTTRTGSESRIGSQHRE